MRLKKGKLYKLAWNDITTDNEWRTLKSINEWAKELKPILSTWYYIGRNGDWLIFSSGISKDKEAQYFDCTALPKGVITKITPI